MGCILILIKINQVGFMSHQHGGRRKGAGRKTGSLSKMTQEVTQKALANGLTPIEVLLDLMGKAYQRGDEEMAGKWADKAAPYCHPRLSSTDQHNDDNVVITYVNEFPDAKY
jgi:hypothetical protein